MLPALQRRRTPKAFFVAPLEAAPVACSQFFVPTEAIEASPHVVPTPLAIQNDARCSPPPRWSLALMGVIFNPQGSNADLDAALSREKQPR